jgi:outer membrane protein, heavy metal efflux system
MSAWVRMAGALGWLACAGAGAQSVAPAPVTLEAVLQAARENPDVAIARRALAATQGDVLAADHVPAPQLTVKSSSMDLQHGLGSGNVLADKRIDKSVGLDWTYERGGKRLLRTRAAERSVGAARFDLHEVEVQQQIAAAGAFYDLLAAQERAAQVEAIEHSAAQLATASQRRLRAGDVSRQETARIEIEAQRAAADLRGAQADRQRAQFALAQLTRLPADVLAQGGWPPLTAAAASAADAEQRPDVQAARQRVEAAQAALDSALALRRNDVTVGASYDHFPGTSTRLIEVRLQMPLAGVLGGYDYQGEIARARAQLDQAQDQLDKVRLAATLDNQRLLHDVAASAARARTFQEDIVPRARQVAAQAELAYGKGATSLTELIDARRTLRAVLLDDIAAHADYARALSAWQLRQAAASLS